MTSGTVYLSSVLLATRALSPRRCCLWVLYSCLQLFNSGCGYDGCSCGVASGSVLVWASLLGCRALRDITAACHDSG
jgi:hypothetical protein